MSEPVSIKFAPGVQKLITSGPRDVVLRAIARAVDDQNEETIGQAVEKRMSFPKDMPSTLDGLRVQSSHLRRSLTRSNARISGNGILSSIGSNKNYFGVHEFGFQGEVEVKQFTRKRPDRVKLNEGRIVDLTTAARLGVLTRSGKARKGNTYLEGSRDVIVHAHTRQMNMPAREMVQRTVLERLGDYQNAIGESVSKALGA